MIIRSDLNMSLYNAIWENDAEYLAIVDDLLNHPEVRQLENFVHHLFTNRLDHSLMVSYTSYRIAKRLNRDYRSVARAGLLHDFFLLKVEEVEALAIGSHNNVHPRLALENALRITELNQVERDIILKHMFLCSKVTPPRYLESMIVSMIDKYVALVEVGSPLNTKLSNKIIKTIYRLRPVVA